jgi:hypothetical protein
MPDYIVIRINDASEIRDAMCEAARIGIGECILIAERHRSISECPSQFDALLDELRQHSAAFKFEAM